MNPLNKFNSGNKSHSSSKSHAGRKSGQGKKNGLAHPAQAEKKAGYSSKPSNAKSNKSASGIHTSTAKIRGEKSKAKSQTSAKKKQNSEQSNRTMKVVTVNSSAGLHKRNVHQGRYDFTQLVAALPELADHVIHNPRGEQSIRFDDPLAVKLLNKALLAHHYGVTHWDIPAGYLCPPIPGRADYIHRLAELLSTEFPLLDQTQVRALDIGVGANCIYPIVATTQYGWSYVGSDVDPQSVENSNDIATNNAVLKGHIECRLQPQSRHFFKGIIEANERYDVTTCNPPFHKSLQEAQQGTERKINNLNANKLKRGQQPASMKKGPTGKPSVAPLNFGGQKAELWCPGGEAEFVKNLAFESRDFSKQVLWFTTLLSKKENVRWLCKNLEKVGANEVKIVEMSQGQKISRFVAWSFKSAEERQQWFKN